MVLKISITDTQTKNAPGGVSADAFVAWSTWLRSAARFCRRVWVDHPNARMSSLSFTFARPVAIPLHSFETTRLNFAAQ